MGFSFKKQSSQNCLVFSLKGRFIEEEGDEVIVDEIGKELELTPKGVVLDMVAMEYINSIGINALVKIVSNANIHNQKIVFVSVPKRIMGLLEIIKLNAVFTIKENVSEGINYLNN